MRERDTEKDRGRGRGSETERARVREKHQYREKKLVRKDNGDRNRDRVTSRANRRTPTGLSRRWRSMDRKEKPNVGTCLNDFGRDTTCADEGVWTKVVSRKTAKDRKKILIADRQTQNLEARGNSTRYHLNWRNKDDITSYYFTHFPDEANEELLWKYFKKWGDVREVYIVKRRNREGRRYGFVRFKGVSDAKCEVGI